MPRAETHPQRNPHLRKGPDGRWLAKLSPVDRETIRYGLGDLTHNEVAAKFGISREQVKVIRRGVIYTRSAVPLLQARSKILPAIPASLHASEAELAVWFLRRAIPLMQRQLTAHHQLATHGRIDIDLENQPRQVRHARPRRKNRARPTVLPAAPQAGPGAGLARSREDAERTAPDAARRTRKNAQGRAGDFQDWSGPLLRD